MAENIWIKMWSKNGYEFCLTNIFSTNEWLSIPKFKMRLINRNKKILPALRKFKPDLLVSSDASYAQLGLILNRPCVTILEDDYKVIKKVTDKPSENIKLSKCLIFYNLINYEYMVNM